MAKINLSIPEETYSADIFTGGMDVLIEDNFLGVKFVSRDGEQVSVHQRDGGFEIIYEADRRRTFINLGNGFVGTHKEIT